MNHKMNFGQKKQGVLRVGEEIQVQKYKLGTAGEKSRTRASGLELW